MLSEKDRAIVAEMCRTGMALETLKKCFPQFNSADVEYIFHEQNKKKSEDDFEINISCNCS